MKWEPHYTGIATTELRWWKLALYLQRGLADKRIQFVRLSRARGFMLGAFIGRTNYLKEWGLGGFECFTNHVHFGWVRRGDYWTRRRWFATRWSGSSIDPYHSLTVRCGRFGFGFQCPKWLRRWKDRKEQRKWEQMPDPPGWEQSS